MHVSQVADKLNTTADTVRFYTRKGFLHPLKSTESGYKNYRDIDIKRLQFIINARELGFSVEDIGKIIGEAEKGRTPCPMVRQLLELYLQETEQRFQEIVAMRKRMRKALNEWSHKPDKLPTGSMVCHLIDNFM